jgi:hypothetical protein
MGAVRNNKTIATMTPVLIWATWLRPQPMKKAGLQTRNRPLTCDGANGIRTSDLLHAMQPGFV